MTTLLFFPTAQDASAFLPYDGDVKVEDAFRVIEEYKEKVEAVRATQVRLSPLTQHDSTPPGQIVISCSMSTI